jgi:minor extracellular serine protease Vpr
MNPIGRVWAILLLALLPALAQRIPGEYLVELEAAPPAARLGAAERAARRAAVRSEQAAARVRLAAMGAEVFDAMETAGNLMAVRWPGDENALMRVPGVRKVYPAYYVYPMLDQARELHGLPEAWALAGGIDNAGKGVRVGIIDTGIDPAHPALQDETLEFPEGFPKFRREADEAVTTRKVIVARSYDDFYGEPGSTSARDLEGHGTAVAMAAAGVEIDAGFAKVSGAAPKAYLGAYRVFSYSGLASTTVVIRALNDAIEDGMQVINLSLGSAVLSNAIDELFSSVARRAMENGAVIVAAAGNEGPEPGTVASPAHLPEILAAGATSHSRVIEYPVSLRERSFAGVVGSGAYPRETIRGEIYDARAADPSGLACSPLPAEAAAGKIALIDRGECFFETKLNHAMRAGARAAVVVNNSGGNPIIMSVGEAALPAIMIRREDGAALRELLKEAPGETAEVAFAGRAVARDPRFMAEFSSRGPSVAARPKPDLSAIGSLVYSATSAGRNPARYSFQNGTSLSAPIVAGAAAALRAHRPGLTAAQYRSLLAGTAQAWGAEGAPELGPLDIGAGLLRLDAALRGSLAASEISLNFGVAVGNAIEARRTVELQNLAAEADTVTLEIHPLAGSAPALESNAVTVAAHGSAQVAVAVNLQAMEPGVALGHVVARSALTGSLLRIPYWFANPSGVAGRADYYGASPAPRAGAASVHDFRIFDTTGLPVIAEDVVVEAETEGLQVLEVIRNFQRSPGLYGVSVRPVAGVNTLRIRRGEFSQTISFRAN